jgi:hypothetical protein
MAQRIALPSTWNVAVELMAKEMHIEYSTENCIAECTMHGIAHGMALMNA